MECFSLEDGDLPDHASRQVFRYILSNLGRMRRPLSTSLAPPLGPDESWLSAQVCQSRVHLHCHKDLLHAMSTLTSPSFPGPSPGCISTCTHARMHALGLKSSETRMEAPDGRALDAVIISLATREGANDSRSSYQALPGRWQPPGHHGPQTWQTGPTRKVQARSKESTNTRQPAAPGGGGGGPLPRAEGRDAGGVSCPPPSPKIIKQVIFAYHPHHSTTPPSPSLLSASVCQTHHLQADGRDARPMESRLQHGSALQNHLPLPYLDAHLTGTLLLASIRNVAEERARISVCVVPAAPTVVSGTT